MNVQEFAALKAGDRVENAASQSSGVVTEVTKMGVRVRWGVSTGVLDSNPGVVTFFYSAQGTAWFHWSKVNMFAPHASDEERN